MPQTPIVLIHFKDLPADEKLQETLQARCEHLAQEFHETARFEITFTEDGAGFTAHGHVTGKSTDVATHASASEMAPAGDQVLEKVERQLRRAHDKRIFSQRRDAQKDPPKRKS